MTQLDRASLEIVSIETVAVRVPLAHRFSGSAYSMDNRCTIVTRLEPANGLVSEVFAWRAFEELVVGGVVVNDVPTYRADHMPYGGVKDSGLGREGVRYAVEDMTELRILVLATPG